MAVAHDGTANVSATMSGASSITLPGKTTSGSDRCGVVSLGGFLGASGSTSGTWGGAAMTVTQLGAGGDAIMLHRVAPATGSSSVIISNLSVPDGIAVAHSYNGVDQGTPTSSPVTGTATAASPASVTVSSAVGDLVVDAFGVEQTAGTITVGAGQTQIANATASAATGAASYEAGAASVTMSWTWASGSHYWEGVAANLKAAGAGGGGVSSQATMTMLGVQ